MNRKVIISKAKLIARIKANKEAHIKDYQQAVVDYKKEAAAQLAQQTKELEEGSLKIDLKLVPPVDKSDRYDKIIQMFEWEVNDNVELTKDEFDEYVLDETSEILHAKMLNSSYRGKY